MAPNTFRRLVNKFELLKPQAQTEDKRRLAFAKAHANDMWQADTMVGPYVKSPNGHLQARLIAFIDDASRVCCHGAYSGRLGHAFRHTRAKEWSDAA